jgi:hypothetical protein
MQTKKVFRKILSALHPKNIGIYLVLSSTIFGLFYYFRTYSQTDTINVNGVAYQDVDADQATWEITIRHKAMKRVASLEELKEKETLLIEFLKENGIEDSEISKGTYDTWPIYKKDEYGNSTDEVKEYGSDIYYKIDTDDVYKISTLGSDLNEFVVRNNIYLSRNERDYIYTGLEDLKIELLRDAIDNARSRAESMGEITGNKVQKLEDASQGVFQINPRDDYSVSGGGNFDTSSIEKTVRATVSVEFRVR